MSGLCGRRTLNRELNEHKNGIRVRIIKSCLNYRGLKVWVGGGGEGRGELRGVGIGGQSNRGSTKKGWVIKLTRPEHRTSKHLLCDLILTLWGYVFFQCVRERARRIDRHVSANCF